MSLVKFTSLRLQIFEVNDGGVGRKLLHHDRSFDAEHASRDHIRQVQYGSRRSGAWGENALVPDVRGDQARGSGIQERWRFVVKTS